MTGAAAGGMAILPQFQGSYYDLQRQQALAQAMMQNSMQNIAPQQTVGSGQYQVMPKASPVAGLGQLGQALLAAKMGGQVSQGMNNLGMQQWGALTGMMGGGQPQGGTAAQSPQPSGAPSADGSAGNVATAGATGGAGDGSAGVAPPQSAAPQQGAMPSGGSAMNPLGMNPQMAAMSYLADPGKYFETQAQAYKPAEITAQIRAAGIDPNSALGHQLAQQALAKANNIPLVAGRAGAPMYDYQGNIVAMAPKIPDNAIPTIQGGRITGVTGLPGAADVVSSNAAAHTAGEGSVLPFSGFGQQGNPLPVTNRTAAATQGNGVPLPLRNNNPGAVSPGGSVAQYPDMQTGLAAMDKNLASYAGQSGTGTLGGIITKWVGSAPNAPAYIKDVTTRLGIPANTPVDLTNPAQRQAVATAIMLHENGPSNVFSQKGGGAQQQPSQAAATPSQPTGGAIYAQPQPGFNEGQTDLQSDLTKKYGALNEANGQAQNTISYLQNIRGLASKAALGQQSDKINFVNGLLSLAGSEKATDTVTANNLLDKYSNQIVARLGTGGLGTDAARSILQSAYPNAHMNLGAINEASDNLVGASQMTQAKARLLQGDYNNRNPQAYNQKEMTFDQNADPRVWQFQNMNPQQRQAFKASMTPEEQQQFGKQIRALTGLGVLK